MDYSNISNEIVFLKDGDIVRQLDGTSISGNIISRNGVLAFDLFKEKYNELSGFDKSLSSYLSVLTLSVEGLSNEVYEISNYIIDDYTKKVLDLSTSLSTDIDRLSNEVCATSSDLQNQIISNDGDIRDINDNIASISNDLYLKPNVLGTNGLSGKVDFLLSVGQNTMEYFSNATQYIEGCKIFDFLSANFGTNYFFKKGFVFRTSQTQNFYEEGVVEPVFQLNANDYVIFNKACFTESAQLTDWHVIRDASGEAEELSAQLTSQIYQTSSYIIDTVEGLSDEVSSISVTLSIDYVKKILNLSTSLSTDIDKLSREVYEISNYIIDDYTKKVLDLSTSLSTDIDRLSGELGSVSVALSNDYVKKISNLSNSLSNDVSKLSNELCVISSYIEDEIDLSIANVEKHINDNYDYSEKTYFKNSGGEISGTVIINAKTDKTALALHQNYQSEDQTIWLSTDFVVDKNGIGLSVGDGERYIRLNARDVNKILVNDQSLCSIISSDSENAFNRAIQNTSKKISEISADTTTFERAQVLATIKQDNGIVSLTSRDLSISELVNADSFVDNKVSNAIQDLSGTTHSEISNACYNLSGYINEKVSIAYKAKGSVQTYDDLTSMSWVWIKTSEEEVKKHLGEVYNVLSGSGKEGISGLNYVWVNQEVPGGEIKWGWDNIGGLVDFSNYDTRTEVNEKIETSSNRLTSDYTGKILDLSNILSSQIKSDYDKLSSVDFDIDSRLNRVSVDLDNDEITINALTGYADKLSSEHGIINTLSTDISSLGLQGIRQVKFYKHVNYFDGLMTRLRYSSLYDMFNQLRLWTKDSSKTLNGLMFDVRLSNDLDVITFDDTTSDLSGLSIANGDYVFVNDSRYQEHIPLDELKYSATVGGNETNIYVLKSGIQRFEYISFVNKFEALKEQLTNKISSCYSSISGLNYDSDYKDCISATVNMQNLLFELVETLKN